MGDKEDYLTSYREFFENFAATVNPEDQLPVNIAGYTITETELPGEVLYWTTQYLTEKSCPLTLLTPLLRIILDEVRIAAKKQPDDFGYRADEGVYIALRLMQAVTARVNDVCLRYLDNSRLDSLPPPPAQRDLKTVSIATKNSRRVMEDRHVEIGNLEALFGVESTEPTSFYAVYDGHAGSAAATYCAAHLHQYLVESAHFRTDLRRALRDAFLRTDAEFVRKSNQERACGGSTAVAVAVRGRRLLAGWAGDSLALLAKRMRLMQLVRPHKPSRQDERDRIESSGGTVMFWGTWRVNGQLAVSRAIGDAQYKPYVTARPECATVELDGDEDFVVVACDGLWDFVSEDDVALAVYRQLAADPDDLKAVTKRLVVQAKRQGSADNISIIVVFLKDPRDIAADNCLPMDLGLDNALANAPPFVLETEARKLVDGAGVEAEAECAEAEADNGVDNSDSDSEDLGPETAVDVDADDMDADRHHDPQPPTPPAHTVEANHVDGGLVDNVAESGEESEDEWNYIKGEGEREADGREQADEPPRDDTPCQDNSAWETSSVDMNSSPLNPDAPVFVPGGVSDVVLAESPRKPLPMDDIELPDDKQFRTEAVVRPADLLDLDNCDQLNGHHNVSIDETVKEHFNGNDKCNMDSLGFGFGVGLESEKTNDTGLIQDFERIQKDTTDFCNIQVFQAHTATNPFEADSNDELFERLKNKERDPMSMSFYQEKDDDTAERRHAVDLNSVQPLPDSEDEDATPDDDKENVNPRDPLLGAEPNNDIIRFDTDNHVPPGDPFGDNLTTYDNTAHNFTNEFEPNREEVAHTETPESHKLLFEQIPEIPDGKSSELGFANEASESADRATPQEEMSQDVDMESKQDDSPLEETQPRLSPEFGDDHIEADREQITPAPADEVRDFMTECDVNTMEAAPALTPEQPLAAQQDILADVHQDSRLEDSHFEMDVPVSQETDAVPDIHFESEAESPVPVKSPVELESAMSPVPVESPLPAQSPAPAEPAPSPRPEERLASPAPAEVPLPRESPLPAELAPSPTPAHELALSPEPAQELAPSPIPAQELAPSPVPAQDLAPSPIPSQDLAPSPIPSQELAPSPIPSQELAPSPVPTQELAPSPIPAQELAPSPQPQELAPSPEPAREPSPAPSAPSPAPAQELAPSPAPIQEPLLSPADALAAALSPAPEPAQSPAPEAPRPETASPRPPSAAAASPAPESSGPAPDIVPEEPPRSDLVTDIDIGIPESRAQEICLPVTSEIQHDEPVAAATPPPTPAVDAAPAPAPAPLSDTPIAADPAPAVDPTTAAVAAAAAAVAATAAVAAGVAKTKSATPTAKKTPSTKTTPAKPTPKAPATTRTPASASKKAATPAAPPAGKSPAPPRAAPARTPGSAPRAAPAATRTTPAKASAPAAAAAARPAPAKTAAAPPKAAPAPRSAPPAKPAPAKEPAAVSKTATATRAAPAARPAPRPAPARPATAPATKPAAPAAARPAPARPASARPAGPASAARPKPAAEKKPLTNGDVKPAAAKPAPRPAPAAARPAPRPTPRAPAATNAAPAQTKSAAPKPAPRATRPPAKDADKQNKDLANKRITAKAAPPRTAPVKQAAPVTKVPPIKSPASKKAEAARLEALANGAVNGALEAAGEGCPPDKAPPSPPADSALLPDVIA